MEQLVRVQVIGCCRTYNRATIRRRRLSSRAGARTASPLALSSPAASFSAETMMIIGCVTSVMAMRRTPHERRPMARCRWRWKTSLSFCSIRNFVEIRHARNYIRRLGVNGLDDAVLLPDGTTWLVGQRTTVVGRRARDAVQGRRRITRSTCGAYCLFDPPCFASAVMRLYEIIPPHLRTSRC